ncbi:hypothetical protein P4S64_19010 [Vibrio sp. M60_M31a]
MPFIFRHYTVKIHCRIATIFADFLKLSQDVENVYMIDMEGQPLKSDSLHFDHIAPVFGHAVPDAKNNTF